MHTASDFAPPPDPIHDLANGYARRAARMAVDGEYFAAISEYATAIHYYRQSSRTSAPDRIRFAEAEIARLKPLTGGVR